MIKKTLFSKENFENDKKNLIFLKMSRIVLIFKNDCKYLYKIEALYTIRIINYRNKTCSRLRAKSTF